MNRPFFVVRTVALSIMLATVAPERLAATNDGPMPRASGVFTIAGTPHPYLTEGTGVTCVVVGLASSYPPLFTSRLKQRIRFVYVDFKNSWNTESGARVQSVTLDSLVEEVDQIRRGLGLEQVCLVGHSAPGLVATEYALRHATRVSRLILVGVEPYLTPDFIKQRAAFWDADASVERKAAFKRNTERISDDLLRSLPPRDAFAFRYVRNGPRYFYDPSYDFYWAFSGRNFSAEMLEHYLTKLVAQYDPRPRFAGNTVPTLLVLGRYDYNIPYREWDGPSKTTPRLTSYVFERSGHFPMLEEPDRFDETVIRWLETAR